MDGAALWGCLLAIALSRPARKERFRRTLSGKLMALLVLVDIASNLGNGQHNYSLYEPIILALLVVCQSSVPKVRFDRFSIGERSL